MDHEEHERMMRSVHSGSGKKRRMKLSKSQAEMAGRKAASIMHEEPQTLTAKTARMKRKQAYAIAASKIKRGEG